MRTSRLGRGVVCLWAPLVVCLVALTGPAVSGQVPSSAPRAVSTFRFIDNESAAPVRPRSVEIDGHEVSEFVAADGLVRVELDPGEHWVVVNADGYHEMRAWHTAAAPQSAPNIFELVSAAPKDEVEAGPVRELSGWVRAADDHGGIAAARVVLESASVRIEAETGATGAYRIAVPDGAFDGEWRVTAEAKGWGARTWTGEGSAELPARLTFSFVLFPAEDTIRPAIARTMAVLPAGSGHGQVETQAQSAPNSIRVGVGAALSTATGCTGMNAQCTSTYNNCPSVQVVDRETYVKRVLRGELFGTTIWNDAQLENFKAMAVAIRSYGSWRALNSPLGSQYDLCNSAYCQCYYSGLTSFGPTSTSASDQTSGAVMVTSGGNIGKTEYGAWNGPCSRGYMHCTSETGFPNVTLLYDWAIDQNWSQRPSNSAAWGHGRGMSQYGAHYRAKNGNSYSEILDFYYDDYGWHLSSGGGSEPPPSNDNCSNATTLTSGTSCSWTSGTVANATASGVPKPSCDGFGNPTMQDVWFKFTAVASSQTITVDPLGSSGDQVVVLYGSCGGSVLGCADSGGLGGNETINATGLSVGSTYYIRVYDYGDDAPTGTNAQFNICVTGTPVTTYTLAINGSGSGNGTVSGSGINCTINSGNTSGTCSAPYNSGTSVNLSASPGGSSTFGGWSGASCSGTGGCTVSMTANRTVTATFNTPSNAAPSVTITSPTSSSSHATSSSAISLGGTASDDSGVTQVTWSNNRGGSGTASGTTSWTISNITLQTGDNVITVIASDSAGLQGQDTITVTYTAPPPNCYALSASANPAAGGSASVGSSTNCSGGYLNGTAVSISASANGGYDFASWSSSNCTLANANSASTTCTITGTGSAAVTAHFTERASLTRLTPGVAVSGLASAQTDQWMHFVMTVPQGATGLVFAIAGGSGDADLYVRRGAQPTASTYDCRPYLGGNAEQCVFATPAGGEWYASIHTFSPYAGVTLTGNYTPPQAVHGDFNADGKTDLVWQNTGSASRIMLLNGAALLSEVTLPANSDARWLISGVGDFDHNGSCDLVWRNTGTFETTVWLMNGTAYASSSPLPGVSSSAWRIAGTGDFDGNGTPDLVWQNATTFRTVVWLMNGTQYAGEAVLPSVSSPDWSIRGVGDFNGDGKPDLVWRNLLTYQSVVWLMNGTTYAGEASLPPVSSRDWNIEALGDYNGDGKTDLVWRNAATTDISVWLLNGTAIIGELLPPKRTSEWRIVAPK